jgi:hypothetical protein
LTWLDIRRSRFGQRTLHLPGKIATRFEVTLRSAA